MQYRYGRSVYDIAVTVDHAVTAPSVATMSVDGQASTGAVLHLLDDGAPHSVHVRVGGAGAVAA